MLFPDAATPSADETSKPFASTAAGPVSAGPPAPSSFSFMPQATPAGTTTPTRLPRFGEQEAAAVQANGAAAAATKAAAETASHPRTYVFGANGKDSAAKALASVLQSVQPAFNVSVPTYTFGASAKEGPAAAAAPVFGGATGFSTPAASTREAAFRTPDPSVQKQLVEQVRCCGVASIAANTQPLPGAAH